MVCREEVQEEVGSWVVPLVSSNVQLGFPNRECDSGLSIESDCVRSSVVRVKVIVKVIDLQTSSQRDLSYMALT